LYFLLEGRLVIDPTPLCSNIMKRYATLLLALSLGLAQAMAVDIFLKIDDLKGETTDIAHKDAIDVLVWSWGMSQSGSTHTGGGAGRANFQDLSFTKYVDRTSVKLIEGLATGKHFDSAVLIVRKGGEKPVEYIKITMYNIIVSSVSTGGSGGEDRLTENVSLNFSKFLVEYVPVDFMGNPGIPIPFKWDIAANAVGG
jgi:type VI secretion system secreted protein Hcp